VTGILLLPAGADRDEWLEARQAGIGASEIAAVMGISPYDSPFSCWWRKRNGWAADVTEEMSAGTRLEPIIADWFAERAIDADGEPTMTVRPAGLYRHTERPWQLATPDRLLMLPREDRPARFRCGALLECKAAFSWDGWGEPGTDQIPVHYRAQALWQMDTVGVDLVHVAVFSGLSFRSYLVRRDEKDLAAMREAGRRFWQSLIDDTPPDVDDHSATLPILRRLHADIEDREQEIPAHIAEGWQRAKRFTSLAKRVEAKYTAQLRDHLGTAKTAVLAGRKFAARTSNDTLRSAK
jgi:putative phage-type endonuclease